MQIKQRSSKIVWKTFFLVKYLHYQRTIHSFFNVGQQYLIYLVPLDVYLTENCSSSRCEIREDD